MAAGTTALARASPWRCGDGVWRGRNWSKVTQRPVDQTQAQTQPLPQTRGIVSGSDVLSLLSSLLSSPSFVYLSPLFSLPPSILPQVTSPPSPPPSLLPCPPLYLPLWVSLHFSTSLSSTPPSITLHSLLVFPFSPETPFRPPCTLLSYPPVLSPPSPSEGAPCLCPHQHRHHLCHIPEPWLHGHAKPEGPGLARNLPPRTPPRGTTRPRSHRLCSHHEGAPP